MEYFINTVGIVAGILLPVYLLIGFSAFGKIVDQEHRKDKKRLAKALESDNWRFLKIEQAPNPEMVSLEIANYDSDHTFRIGIYKSDLQKVQS